MTGRGVGEEELLLLIIKEPVLAARWKNKLSSCFLIAQLKPLIKAHTFLLRPSNIFPLLPCAHAGGDISAGRASFVGRVKDTMTALRWTDFFLGGGVKTWTHLLPTQLTGSQ